MSVMNILGGKARKVYSVNEDSSLRDAIGVLNARNIGVVLVTGTNGKLAGILSERDIIRKSLAQETGFRDEPVTKSMTKNVITAQPDASIDDIMTMMTASRIRHIPILDKEKIVGIVSIGDIVKRKISDIENEAAVLRDYISTG